MAESFMIQFACNGRHCYANVYAYDTFPKEYHVHIVNLFLYTGLPEHLVLVEKNGKLRLMEPAGVDEGLVRAIAREIERMGGL
jgi:hypothetical protein